MDPDPVLEPGTLIGGRYQIERLLGEGGMGRVYAARHTALARKVALKLLRRDAAQSEDGVARFRQEAYAASSVGAPQIVEILDFATHGEGALAQTYMVMELLVGESLEDWMDREATLDGALALLAELCEGLAAAHEAGVIHRDIKPANVFLRDCDPDEAQPVRVKILDFGIAKVTVGSGGFKTQRGSILGTPYYLAPERVLGEPLSAAADIYSVGVILYEMLTGDVPFSGATFMTVLAQHVNELPLDPRQAAPERPFPDPVADFCMRLLAKRPRDRPDAHEVAATARALLVAYGVALARVPTGPRSIAAASSEGGDCEGTQRLAESLSMRPTVPPVERMHFAGDARAVLERPVSAATTTSMGVEVGRTRGRGWAALAVAVLGTAGTVWVGTMWGQDGLEQAGQVSGPSGAGETLGPGLEDAAEPALGGPPAVSSGPGPVLELPATALEAPGTVLAAAPEDGELDEPESPPAGTTRERRGSGSGGKGSRNSKSKPAAPKNTEPADPEAKNPEPEAKNPEPETKNPEPETKNPEPEPKSPEPELPGLPTIKDDVYD